MNEENAPASVFLSYAHADREIASRIQKDLLKRDITIWRDLENIRAGDDWEEQVREAIRTCNGIIYLATPDARGSSIVRGELMFAKTYGKPIYPLWATGRYWVDVVSLEDISTQYIDIRGNLYEDGLLQLIKLLRPPSHLPIIDNQSEEFDVQENFVMNATPHASSQKRKSPGVLRTLLRTLRSFLSDAPNRHDMHRNGR